MVLTIHGNPVAQGRPRFFRRGNYVGAYDPGKSKTWKDSIRLQAIQQGAKIIENAASMDMVFYLARPKSLSKKIVHHVKRPDLDNLVKAVKDGLSGVCFKDDSQINAITAQKMYAVDFVGVFVRIVPS